MKDRKKRPGSRAVSLLFAALLLSSCEFRSAEGIETAASEISEAIIALADSAARTEETAENRSAEQAPEPAEEESTSGGYSSFDLDESVPADAVRIQLEGSSASFTGDSVLLEEGKLTIREGGSYVLSGSYEGQIIVRAPEDDRVRLIFDGVNLSAPMAPVYVRSCKDASITLAEGSVNSVSDAAEYTFAEGEDEPDAAIFSKCDLTVNGSGSLNVTGNYACGIRSKDDLRITNGILNVSAVTDAVKGKDSLRVKNGTLTIVSGQDGLKSNNDTDEERGYVVIDGGNIEIDAGDDAIHGESKLTVNGGVIRISQCYEGLEAKKVEIYGGDIAVNATDDGINAASGSSGEGGAFEIRDAVGGGGFGDFLGQMKDWFGGESEDGNPGGRQDDFGTPPEPPEQSNRWGEEPPAKPDDSWGGQPPEKPDGNMGEEPPEKPDGNWNEQPAEWQDQSENRGRRGGGGGGKGGFGGGMGNEAPEEGVWIKIAGGTIRVSGKNSDVIDSNGTFEMTGGVLITEASNMTMYGEPDGVLDTNGDLVFSGGTFVSLCRSDGSGYASLFASPSIVASAGGIGSRVTLTAEDGTELLSFEQESEARTVFIASDLMAVGAAYTLTVGDSSVTFTAAEETQRIP